MDFDGNPLSCKSAHVIFVEEEDKVVNPLGAKGLGELMPLIRALLALGAEGEVRVAEMPCDYFLVNAGSIAKRHRQVEELVLPTLTQRIQTWLR